MSPTSELESLCERDDVDGQTGTRTLIRTEFETAPPREARTVGSPTGQRTAVDRRGRPRLGAPRRPRRRECGVGGIARRAIESLTGREAGLDEPVCLREVEFRQEGAPDSRRTTYDVLIRSAPVSGRPEPTAGGEDVADLIWLDRVPEDASNGLAADVRSVLN